MYVHTYVHTYIRTYIGMGVSMIQMHLERKRGPRAGTWSGGKLRPCGWNALELGSKPKKFRSFYLDSSFHRPRSF